ncbi:hypothetical protein KEM55_000980 [Ascosphaera atra]|nr:hypothetical protein KEM55_000980 [Ascosphaera atra]
MSTNTNTIPLWINGQEVPAADAASTFKIVSPRDSSELWDAASVTLDQANQAAQAAAAAFPAWSKTKPIARRTILLRAADLIETRADELMGYMKQEVGAQEFFPSINISITTEILRDTAGRISGALTGSLPVCQENDTHAMVVKEPYGVVLAIAPCLVRPCGRQYMRLEGE